MKSKKIITMVLTGALLLASAVPALAQRNEMKQKDAGLDKGFKQEMRKDWTGKEGRAACLKMDKEEWLAKLAKEKGITVEELKQKMDEEKGFWGGKKGRGPKERKSLEELAKEKGITVEELKEQLKQQREEKLAKIAEQRGITVEALKAEMEQKREERLKKMAEKKGITVEELKKMMEEKCKLREE